MIDGTKTSELFLLVARYGKELNAFGESLENSMVQSLQFANLPCLIAEKARWVYRNDDSNWITTDKGCSIPLKSKGKGKKKIEAYIVFQISLTGAGAQGTYQEPMLHIGLWRDAINFKDGVECFLNFPMEHFEPVSSVQLERLLIWDEYETGWSKSDWTYSLRILALNSIEDIQKYVVRPVLALLGEMSVHEALPDEWLGHALIRYDLQRVSTMKPD